METGWRHFPLPKFIPPQIQEHLGLRITSPQVRYRVLTLQPLQMGACWWLETYVAESIPQQIPEKRGQRTMFRSALGMLLHRPPTAENWWRCHGLETCSISQRMPDILGRQVARPALTILMDVQWHLQRTAGSLQPL
jgi:hypothetical protein